MNFTEKQFKVKRNNTNQDDDLIKRNNTNQNDLTKRNNTNQGDNSIGVNNKNRDDNSIEVNNKNQGDDLIKMNNKNQDNLMKQNNTNKNQGDNSIKMNNKSQDNLMKQNNTNQDDDVIDLISFVANPVSGSMTKKTDQVDQELDDDYYEYDLDDEDFDLNEPFELNKFLAKLIKRIAKTFTSVLRAFQSTSENEFYIRLYIAYHDFINIFKLLEEFLNPKGYY